MPRWQFAVLNFKIGWRHARWHFLRGGPRYWWLLAKQFVQALLLETED